MPFRLSIYNHSDLKNWLNDYWPALLMLLAFFGFISKSLFQYPIGLMAILGTVVVIRNPALLIRDDRIKMFCFIFLAIWLPMLIATIDAYHLEKSLRTTLGYVRFLFAGIFIIQAFTEKPSRITFVAKGVALLVGFWVIDASIQFFIGVDLLGYPGIPGHITGMFYPELQLPHICSILSVFLFLFIYQHIHKSLWPLLLLLPLFFVIFIAGRRATWVMLALNSFGFLLYLFIYSDNRHRKKILWSSFSTAIVISLMLVITATLYKPIKNRLTNTMGLFSGDLELIDKATAKRLPIWETATTMIKANPVNGVGPRSFRFAYPDYRQSDNYFKSQTHPHLLILEITTETGLLGLTGYCVCLFLLCRVYFNSQNRKALFPLLLPVVVAFFPLNAHMAFFGSVWSSMIWLLVILFISKAGEPNIHHDQ